MVICWLLPSTHLGHTTLLMRTKRIFSFFFCDCDGISYDGSPYSWYWESLPETQSNLCLIRQKIVDVSRLCKYNKERQQPTRKNPENGFELTLFILVNTRMRVTCSNYHQRIKQRLIIKRMIVSREFCYHVSNVSFWVSSNKSFSWLFLYYIAFRYLFFIFVSESSFPLPHIIGKKWAKHAWYEFFIVIFVGSFFLKQR